MSQQPTPIDDLFFGRLRDALRNTDPHERKQAAQRELNLLLKALDHAPRKKRGRQPPDVDAAVMTVLRPMWEAVIDYGDLLPLSLTKIRRLKPGQTFECKSMPIYNPESGKTSYFQIQLTSKVLEAVKNWKELRLMDVVGEVQDAIEVRMCGLQEELKGIPDSRAYRKQRNDIQKQLDELDDILQRDEARLSGHIRDAAIRFLLSCGLTWYEMPPNFVDKRQTWLGKNRMAHFYNRQKVLLKYDGSYTRKEFESRHKAFLSTLKDPTN